MLLAQPWHHSTTTNIPSVEPLSVQLLEVVLTDLFLCSLIDNRALCSTEWHALIVCFYEVLSNLRTQSLHAVSSILTLVSVWHQKTVADVLNVMQRTRATCYAR
eukprot:8283-Heterococcus_DN1.PRE.2